MELMNTCHVVVSLGELHLVHSLARVPVQERLPPKHGAELIWDAAEEFRDARRVADKGRRGFQAPRRDVAHGRLHVAGYPFHEVGGILVLRVMIHSERMRHFHISLQGTPSIDPRYSVEMGIG